jgi:hypothetical protein
MITNKYESPPNYQSLKERRLRQIQEDYFPPPPKSFFKGIFYQGSPYTHTSNYAPDPGDDFSPDELFEVKNAVKENFYQIIFAVLIFLFFFIPADNGISPLYFSIPCSAALIIHAVVKMKDRRPRLMIDADGLHFYKRDLFISWGNIIATHIFLDRSEDSPVSKLVTDYIDELTGQCQTHQFEINGYDKKAGAIAVAITWYQKARDKSANKHINSAQ